MDVVPREDRFPSQSLGASSSSSSFRFLSSLALCSCYVQKLESNEPRLVSFTADIKKKKKEKESFQSVYECVYSLRISRRYVTPANGINKQ